METTVTVKPVRIRSSWEQRILNRKTGETLIRIIEIIGKPTLSSPVNYRIIRNDAHPHRAGKTASIRRSELHRKYQAR